MRNIKQYIVFGVIILSAIFTVAQVSNAYIYNPTGVSQNISPTASPTFASTTLSNFTQGSVVFAGAGGALTQDNPNFFYDVVNHFLGIATSSPTTALSVGGTGIYASGKIGVSTNVPTHSLTIGSTGTGIALYNTVDQTTNFERLIGSWSGNIFTLGTSNGGGGSIRNINIMSGNVGLSVSSAGTLGTGSVYKNLIASAITGTGSNLNVNSTFNGSSGIQTMLGVTGTLTQTSTAGYTGILVNPTESTIGSGQKNIADFQVGNTSLWRIDDKGHVIGGGTSPALTSCGSGPTITGNDHAGTVVGGTGSTGCTVTFANTYATAPHCTVTAQTGSLTNIFSYSVSVSAITTTETSFGTGKFDYVCID